MPETPEAEPALQSPEVGAYETVVPSEEPQEPFVGVVHAERAEHEPPQPFDSPPPPQEVGHDGVQAGGLIVIVKEELDAAEPQLNEPVTVTVTVVTEETIGAVSVPEPYIMLLSPAAPFNTDVLPIEEEALID